MCGEKTYYTYQVKEQETEKYHVQCARCYCTLYSDALEDGEEHTYIITGEICYSCQKEKDAEEEEERNRVFEDSSFYHIFRW